MNPRSSSRCRRSAWLLAAALAPASFGPFAAADAGGPGAGAAAAGSVDAQSEAPGERRILRLANGQVLRATARPAGQGDAAGPESLGGAWEVKVNGQWKAIPREHVLRVRTERDALAEYGRLSRGLADQDHVRRLELAGWLEREGLYAELLRELDRVLAADPDAKKALELLRTPAVVATLPLADPDPLRERPRALREGSKALPAQRELWIARLAAEADREGLIAVLEKELAQTVDAKRDFAAHALRRIAPGRSLERLEPLALADRARTVRDEARRALRDARTPIVVERLAPRIESPSLKERIGAIDTIGIAGHAAGEAAIEPLIAHLVEMAKPKPQGGGGGTVPRSHFSLRRQVAYVQDFNVEIAQAASIADPIVDFAEEGAILDVAAATWQLPIVYQYESALTRRALTRLTGEGEKRTPQQWIDWWKARKPGEPGGGPEPGGPGTGRPATGPGGAKPK